ncbi:methyl-accepting chemotaxis protein [Oceanimonas baumannii]|uniref:Methyl-accepting chemotaxis protein n=1 Tax=Oceanimonas baumannii TaxID=129578 RepID=A0A235CN24_9GAMM|nr:methyl-accepting chemotaxis protein [Oceanimonas baumannii]OYD25978.1 methyl-accepting chemotaxis protein [Oceanimonas baumannii]TDW59999.1 methyl-accepting chemotaxis protein [Oceanimonas baumannii]
MLRKIRIAPRSAMAFGTLGLITLIIGLMAIAQLKSIDNLVSGLTYKRIPATNNVGKLRQNFLLLRLYTLNAVYPKDDQHRRESLSRLQELEKEFDHDIQTMQSYITTDEGKALHARLEAAKSQYDQRHQQLVSMIQRNQQEQAEQFRYQGFNELGIAVSSALDNIANYHQRRATLAAEQANSTIKVSTLAMGIAMIVAIALVVVLALLFSRSLLLPIRKAVEVSETIASGNLTTHFSDDAKDEAGEMIRALAAMQQQLKNTILDINDSSTQLASTAEELSVVTDQSTRTLQQQSDELEQAATAVNEMTSAVEEVARNAAATSQNSDIADDKARIGHDKVMHTINTVTELEQEIVNTRQGVESLANRVRDIGSVLDVIRGIAEQTNLLALNAAIEAARAGESGRGFAVVADEVRALAHRTQESTKEIESMMHAIQNETNDTVNAIHVSTERSVQTRQVAQEAGEALQLITEAIIQINEQNQTIASAAEEQASVSREVDRNLVNIRDLSVQTSAGAHQTNVSSNDLARLAERLHQLVTQFRV